MRTKASYPLHYAATHSILGNAYSRLAGVRDAEENLTKAIAAINEALTVTTKATYPLHYATAQSNLGTAYETLAGVRDADENLTKAIAAYNEALTVTTKKKNPAFYEWLVKMKETICRKTHLPDKNRGHF